MKKTKTIILLVILLTLLCAVILARTRSPIQKRYKLFNTPPERITSISLSNSADSLYIQKDNLTGIWYAHYPLSVKISPVKLQNFFTVVMDIDRFDKILANDPMYYEKYNVSYESGVLVTLYDERDDILEEYIFGISDLITYGSARKTNSTIVYELSKNIEYDIAPRLSNWRITEIINFTRTQADSIHVVYTKDEYSLINKDNVWFFDNADDTFQLTNAHRLFFRAMNQLENLRTASFYDNQWDELAPYFDNPMLTITIYYKDSRIDTVTFATHPDHKCIIMLNNFHDTLYQGVYDMADRFTRSANVWKTDVVRQRL